MSRICPRCGKPEYASAASDFCYSQDCYWRTVAAEGDGTEVQFISALDDAEIRVRCFSLVAEHSSGRDFPETLANATVLYDWVMGKDELEIEEAAEPASVSPEESCEPKPH